MLFKIDWASLILGRKFSVFALFYFVFEDNFPSTSPRGLIFGGATSQRVFCVTDLGGLYLEGLNAGCWPHTCDACVTTTWRLGLKAPLVARNNNYVNKSNYPGPKSCIINMVKLKLTKLK